MLSKTELEFLKAPERFEPDYRRTLRFRIKSKVEKIKSEIALLEANGISVTENRNGVTEFCNGGKIERAQKQTDFGKEWWAGQVFLHKLYLLSHLNIALGGIENRL